MSLFDSMKKSLGLSKNKHKSTGHVLGHSNQEGSNGNGAQPQVVSEDYWEFELSFTAEKLGMSLKEVKVRVLANGQDSKEVTQAVVAIVSPESQAATLGVKEGDIITSLNGHAISMCEDFSNFLAGLGRPVRITVLRKKTGERPVSMPQGGSHSLGLQSLFRGFSGSSQSQQAQLPQLSEEEKSARREAMRKAAADRSQQWDRKVGTSKKNVSAVDALELPQSAVVENHNNPETLKAVQKTKEMEKQTEKNLGYSPFRPHMSFSGNVGAGLSLTLPSAAAGSTSSPSPLPSPAEQSPPPYSLTEDEHELIVADVDDAFAMLLSLGEDEQERAKVAVQTVQKMLQNLLKNQYDVKFRSIRLGNKAFQSKVGSVPGALELLIAGGFVLQDGDSNVENPGESYLHHPMSHFGQRRLEYALFRLQDLTDMQLSERLGSNP